MFRIHQAAVSAFSVATLLALAAMPSAAHACACGCGIFDLGDGSITPTNSDSGFSVWARFAHMAQSQLREGGHDADPADNGDKRIATDFYTLGGQYMINRQWMVMAEMPLIARAFTTTDDGTWAAAAGTVNTRHITSLGDATLRATYTGLAADMSTGLSLGVKLPTGRWHSPLGPLGGAGFDRDTMPGSGSTDLSVGAYHVGRVVGRLNWFVQGQYQFAIASQGGYRPGNEADGTAGLSYDASPAASTVRFTPMLQLLGSIRKHDTGDNSDPVNTGYQRLLIAPGLKVKLGRKLSVFGDVEVPVAQYSNAGDPTLGDAGQLTSKVQLRLQVNYAL